MKKIVLMIFIIFSVISFSDTNITQTPEELQRMEFEMEREEAREQTIKLIKLYESKFNEHLKSIRGNEEKVFNLGDEYFKQRKYERAAKIFSSNISSARNLFGAGTCYRFIGQYNKAIDFYSEAINKDPSMKEAYLGKGLAYRELGQYNKAIDNINVYMNYGETVEGFLALGDIYLAEKQIYRAREILQKGRKKFPKSKAISEMLISTYSK